MKTLDRGNRFSGYWLSDDGESIGDIKPYHHTKQGTVDGRILLFCIFFEEEEIEESAVDETLVTDDETETEETETEETETLPVEYANKEEMLSLTDYAGHTFEDVIVNYPVTYTEYDDDDGNSYQIASHRANSQEGI